MNEKHNKKEIYKMNEMKKENEIIYKICSELYYNKEKYEKLEIYECVEKVRSSKVEILNTPIPHTDRENINSLCNLFRVQFEIMLGRTNCDPEGIYVLGKEVRPSLDLKYLGVNKSIELLNALYCIGFEKETDGRLSNKRRHVRQILDQINVDKPKDMLCEIMEKIVGKDVKDLPTPEDYKKPVLKEREKEEYEKIAERCREGFLTDYPEALESFEKKLEENMKKGEENNSEEKSVQRRERNTAEILEDTYDLYYQIFKCYGRTKSYDKFHKYVRKCLIGNKPDTHMKRQESLYPQFGALKKYYYAWLYVDLSCYFILQCVIKEIKFSKNVPCRVKNMIESLAKDAEIEPLKIKRDTNEMMFQLFSYYYVRDRFLYHIWIKKYIRNHFEYEGELNTDFSIAEISENEEPMSEEEFFKIFSGGEDRKKEEKRLRNRYMKESLNYKAMILEDIETKDRAFRENYDRIRSDIVMYCAVSGRDNPSDLVLTKAFYRAIYLDKTLFGRRMPRQIFNDIIDGKDVKRSDAYYINEKINIAICREKNMLQQFYEFEQLHENLYYLVCVSLAQLEPKKIVEKFNGFFDKIRQTM